MCHRQCQRRKKREGKNAIPRLFPWLEVVARNLFLSLSLLIAPLALPTPAISLSRRERRRGQAINTASTFPPATNSRLRRNSTISHIQKKCSDRLTQSAIAYQKTGKYRSCKHKTTQSSEVDHSTRQLQLQRRQISKTRHN